MTDPRIAGVGLTAFGNTPERTGRDLFAEAATAALDDAGGARDDVEALFYGNFMGALAEHQAHQGPLMAEAAGLSCQSRIFARTGGHRPPMSLAVAVVDAETPGNVGTVARSMKNFGFSDLLLVDPPDLDPDGEAYGFAGHAREDVLPNATELSFADLTTNYYTVACTAVPNEDDRKHVRYPVATPAEIRDELADLDAPVAVVFGRERVGLTNEELAQMDRICSIPASAEYPTLNLGQAATIVCYELRELGMADDQLPEPRHARAEESKIEGLYAEFERFLVAVNHPPEKRKKATRLFRRLVGRAHPTGREAKTLRGLFRRASQRLEDDEE